MKSGSVFSPPVFLPDAPAYGNAVLEERDYVMRAVKQLADFVARILKLALTDPRAARDQLEAACRETLHMDLSTLSLVDARSAAELLMRADKVVFFASVIEALGELDLLEGATHRARGRFLHALELAHEAVTLDPKSSDALGLIARLRARVE